MTQLSQSDSLRRFPEQSGDELVLRDIADELRKARAKWPAINSVHEGYAVILEEIEEFWTEVKRKQTEHDSDAMYAELVQVAAMAVRTASDCLSARARR